MSNSIPSPPPRPLIGICPDVVEPKPPSPPGSVRAQCALTYARAVAAAGGEPVIVPPLVERIDEVLARLDGLVLTGGDDPRTEAFGQPTDPRATLVHPLRQAFDEAIIARLLGDGEHAPATLGICLGMQMLALVAGGRLNQHLPDTLPTHERHRHDAVHPVICRAGGGGGPLASGPVTSHHRQAVSDPGRLVVLAESDDGVIEAISDPRARFLVGVQWHPERTADERTGVGVLRALVEAARERQISRS